MLSCQDTNNTYFETHALENHVKSKELFVKSSEKVGSVPTKNSIRNKLMDMEAETVTKYPEEKNEPIENFSVYETEVKEK